MDPSEAVANFMAITGADEATALGTLDATSYNLEAAVNLHFASGKLSRQYVPAIWPARQRQSTPPPLQNARQRRWGHAALWLQGQPASRPDQRLHSLNGTQVAWVAAVVAMLTWHNTCRRTTRPWHAGCKGGCGWEGQMDGGAGTLPARVNAESSGLLHARVKLGV